MKYMVMECRPSYAVLLDEEGRFQKAANMNYEVGQTVEDPVLMRFEKYGRCTGRGGAVRCVAALAAACLVLMLGAGYYRNHLSVYASIYLTINPQIQMDVNRRGEVLELRGLNQDGHTLLEGYSSKGKDKITVSDELIDRAVHMGFLSQGGRIAFVIDAPNENVYQEYGAQLRQQVTEHMPDKIDVTIEITDGVAPREEMKPSSPVIPLDPVTDCHDTDYGPDNDGVTDYHDTDYGPDNDGVTDYHDTDYGPDNDGVTDYTDTDYGPDNDGVTDYTDTDYGPDNDGVTDYHETDYDTRQ